MVFATVAVLAAVGPAAGDPHGSPMDGTQGSPMQGDQGSPMSGNQGSPMGSNRQPVQPRRDIGSLRTMSQSGTGDGSFGRSGTVTISAVVGGTARPIIIGGRYNGVYGCGYGYPGLWYYGYRGGFQTSTPVVPVSVPVNYGTPGAVQPASEPAPELTPEQRAWVKLAEGDESGAVAAFRELVKEDGERFELVRALGLALMADGRIDDGVATIRLAYVRDPALASRPMTLAERAMGGGELRQLLRRVVRFAHDRDSASAWLAVAVLMQAEGRAEPARRMLDRAERRSLDAEIVSAFAAELGAGGRG